jgi:predicted O-linked N-acetylglucosamine transferase (SPINDLY family)
VENIAERVGRALALHQAGRIGEAEQLYRDVLCLDPDRFEALHFLGVLEAQRKNFEEADRLMSRSLEINVGAADAFANHARVLNSLKRSENALAACQKALAIDPQSVGALVSSGIALSDLRRHEAALAAYDRALTSKPDYGPALVNRGHALFSLERFDEALACYEKVLAISPSDIDALVGRANAVQQRGDYEAALVLYEQVLVARPDHVAALTGCGSVLRKMHRLGESIRSYERAIASGPDQSTAVAGLLYALLLAGRFEEALAFSEKALAIEPDRANVHFVRGQALAKLGRPAESLASYERALACEPNNGELYAILLFACLTSCEWKRAMELIDGLRERCDSLQPPMQPFVSLTWSDHPQDHLTAAKRYISQMRPLPHPVARAGVEHGRIRVAYLSADFRDHAVGHSIAGLLERHDRSVFETVGISWGPDDGSAVRSRIVSAFDTFLDVASESDRKIADLVTDLEIDIALDLTGYTDRMRPDILARRPAPIQVNYLGYAGTTGLPFIDYMIADEHALPFPDQRFFTEKIAYLPDCFLPHDEPERPVEKPLSRTDAGLPENAFIFCSFNNSWKIGPAMFDIWMRLLANVPGSVLWLAQTDKQAAATLRREAQARGIDPSRLIFAPKVPLREDHLARHRLADLFLDTLPYNAHSTAADALWAGLPVLTCKGTSFAGRVAASALHAAGLPQLVAESLAEYEQTAVRLASDPAALAMIRRRLAENRTTCALFDGNRYRRHIERAYLRMWEIFKHGDAPRSFRVERIQN